MARKRKTSATQDDSSPYNEVPRRHKLNGSQQNLWYLADTLPIAIGVGCAGTGKTWSALAWAKHALDAKRIEHIVYVRSPLEMGRSKLGFIPGSAQEKMAPYLAPLHAIAKELGIVPEALNTFPLPYIQGMTFTNACVILDEAQNLSIEEFRALVTRLGKDSSLIILGDPEQDTRDMGGFPIFLKAVAHCPSVGIQVFDARDNMRHPVIVEVLEALKGL